MKHPLSLKHSARQLTNRKRNLVSIEHVLSQLILELSLSQHLHRLLLKQHLLSLRHLVRQLTNRKRNLVVVEHVPNQLILRPLLSQHHCTTTSD